MIKIAKKIKCSIKLGQVSEALSVIDYENSNMQAELGLQNKLLGNLNENLDDV